MMALSRETAGADAEERGALRSPNVSGGGPVASTHSAR